MRVKYLPANQAWCVLFGDAPVTLYDKSGPLGTLFQTRRELDDALRLCGLERRGSAVRVFA